MPLSLSDSQKQMERKAFLKEVCEILRMLKIFFIDVEISHFGSIQVGDLNLKLFKKERN